MIDQQDCRKAARNARAAGAGRLSGARVLVVDDDPDTCAAVGSLLHGEGAQVRTANGAEAALVVLHRWWPTVLVSDLSMPGGDGYALLRAVRSRRRGVTLPAVVVTGQATADERARTRSAGFAAHLEKPVHAGELVRVVAELTRHARGTHR